MTERALLRVLLASASPRRRDLLERAGYAVDVRPAGIDEARREGERPVAWASRLAREKAAAAGARGALLVAGDTVVHRDGAVFDKPASPEEAKHTLAALAGRWHTVTTAVFVSGPRGQRPFHVDTAVRMRAMTAQDIERYVATGEPLDKAGAYGIQGIGGVYVASVVGSWTNVMGLPIEQTLAALEQVA